MVFQVSSLGKRFLAHMALEFLSLSVCHDMSFENLRKIPLLERMRVIFSSLFNLLQTMPTVSCTQSIRCISVRLFSAFRLHFCRSHIPMTNYLHRSTPLEMIYRQTNRAPINEGHNLIIIHLSATLVMGQ